MHLYAPAGPATTIPVIDLSAAASPDSDKRAPIAAAMHRACRDTGFFYIAGHGVPQDTLQAQFEVTKAFFSLPQGKKDVCSIRHSITKGGYDGIGGEVLDSQDSSNERPPGDLKESFYMGSDLPDDHPHVKRGLRGYGHNPWPKGMAEFRTQSVAYHATMRTLGNRILSLLAESLELAPDWFSASFANSMSALRMVHYPPQRTVEQNQLGAGAHTDWSALTILAQDDVGGLEVRNVAGEWIQAPPIPDTFVINLGDLMARWTNGIYMSNLHRVVNKASGRDRYSLPFFHGPDPDTLIEPIPTCVDESHPPLFSICTAGEHVGEMYRRAYQDQEAAERMGAHTS